MTIAELLVPEFDQEMASTRTVLERVPDAKFGWKPHDKSFAMGDLASHIANMVTWTVDTMTKTEFNMAGVAPGEMNRAAKSGAELLSWFDANVAKARAALQKPDGDYFVPWTLRNGAQVFFSLPRFCLNHIVHHRAQLGVYLRLNNIAVPGVYGPSADES